MSERVIYSVPMLKVKDVERSVKFYEILGFVAKNIMRNDEGTAFWAWLSCYQGGAEAEKKDESAAVMVTLGEGLEDRETHGAMLYLYSRDLPALRERLLASGVNVSAIVSRFYMEKGEMELQDTDGHTVLVGAV